MPVLTLSPGFTLTLPEEVREHLGVRPGDEIALDLEEMNVILRKHQPTAIASPASAFREAANRKNLETPIQYILSLIHISEPTRPY